MRGRCSVSTNSPPEKSRPGSGKQYGHLQRENVLAVNVLVQAVVVAGDILEQQRRRPRLTGPMTALEKFCMRVRIAHVNSHRCVPTIGHCRQRRIKSGSQIGNEIGKRVGKVFVLAAPEAVPCHVDAAAKPRVI